MKYTKINDKNVAIISNVGDELLCVASSLAKNPNVKVNGVGLSDAYLDETFTFKIRAAFFRKADEAVVLVADIVDRFQLACAQHGLTPSAAITKLEAGDVLANADEFRKTSDWLVKKTNTLFKFPEQLTDLSEYLGVDLPQIKANTLTLPNITNPIKKRVLAYYKADVDLRETITSPNTKFKHSKRAPIKRVPSRISAWQAKAALALTPLDGSTALAKIEEAIASKEDGQEKVIIQSAWNNNANFERSSVSVVSLGQILGLDSDAIDDLFILAESFTV
jgi:hypothetical protein